MRLFFLNFTIWCKKINFFGVRKFKCKKQSFVLQCWESEIALGVRLDLWFVIIVLREHLVRKFARRAAGIQNVTLKNVTQKIHTLAPSAVP